MHVSELVEPYVSFHHARLKVEWAKHHIEHLDILCKAFIDAKPYAISNKADPTGGGHRFHAGMNRPMDCRIGLLAGDICGNLRASLDYAWMGLVRASNPFEVKRKTLPIADNRKGLIATIEQAPIGSAVEQAKLLLGDRIKPHRDFSAGGNRAICILNDLCNWNKHNLLAISTGNLTIPTLRDDFGNVIVRTEVRGYIDPHATIIRSQGKFEYEGEPSLEVVFAEHEGIENEPIIPTLVNLSEAASQAVEAFCETFGMPNLES